MQLHQTYSMLTSLAITSLKCSEPFINYTAVRQNSTHGLHCTALTALADYEDIRYKYKGESVHHYLCIHSIILLLFY
jgi:hypothetical protein